MEPVPDREPSSPPRGHLQVAWGAAGAAVFALGLWALVTDAEGWNAVWYVPAWYGWLLMLDAAIYRLQGQSFLSHRRRELAAMLFWSVPFWFAFEAYNLVLRNWYYVFTLRSDPLQELVAWLAFATVLPACFFHVELLSGLGLWRDARCRPWTPTPRRLRLLAAAGWLCITLPVLLPRYAFWMVWAAPILLPEVVAWRRGAPSLLADLEHGRPGRLLRLLAGGLLAGIVWESFNYWARCKWIYTVPGFTDWKLFEMPLAGFAGFPLLAVGAFSTYSVACHFLRGGRSWELPHHQPAQPARPAPLAQAARPAPRRRWALAVLLAILTSLAVDYLARQDTVGAPRPLLTELDGIDAPAAARLRAAGIPTPERLVDAVDRDRLDRLDHLDRLAAELAIDPARLASAVAEARLALHKGMGVPAARLLEAAGIHDPLTLAAADPSTLARRLSTLATSRHQPPPTRAEVTVWVRAARLSHTFRR